MTAVTAVTGATRKTARFLHASQERAHSRSIFLTHCSAGRNLNACREMALGDSMGTAGTNHPRAVLAAATTSDAKLRGLNASATFLFAAQRVG